MKLYFFLASALFFSFAPASFATDKFDVLSAEKLINVLQKTENQSIENSPKTIKITLDNNNNILMDS